MKILITGGSGFLGSELALTLSSMGHEVSLLLRPISRLDRLGQHTADFVTGRVNADYQIEEFVSRVAPDVVVHTACCYGRRGESILEINDANYRLGLLILQAVLAAKNPITFINTGTILDPHMNLYTLTKHHFAQCGHALAAVSGSQLRFINVKLHHMYGPGDDETKFTTQVINACRRNQSDLDLTAGTQARDFIYVDDVVSAYASILDNAETFIGSADIEVGSGVALTVREFAETAHRLTESSTQLNFGALPTRPLEAMHCQANTSRMRSLGWVPKFDLDAGIRKILQTELA